MGEYAIRKSDGKEVKIGTCEDMMYCRYDQINDIVYSFICKNLCWRIPTPDEDGIQVGDFEPSLIGENNDIPYHISIKTDMLDDEDKEFLINHSGWASVRIEKLGLHCSIKCYHGVKLPEGNDVVKFFWNGKTDSLFLSHLVNTDTELKIGIECNACGLSFSMPFNEAESLIMSMLMKLRLLHQCSDYWYKHNDEPCPYKIEAVTRDKRILSICPLSYRKWRVSIEDEDIMTGLWEECKGVFMLNVENPLL